MIEWIILGTILFIIGEVIIIKSCREDQNDFIEFMGYNMLNAFVSFLITILLLVIYKIFEHTGTIIGFILLGLGGLVAIKYLIYNYLVKKH